MTKFGLSSRVIWQIQHKIKAFPEIEEARVFGSRAMGNFKKTSDIDISIFGEKISFDTVAKLHLELEEEISTLLFFDVVHFDSLENENLKKHIAEFGQKI